MNEPRNQFIDLREEKKKKKPLKKKILPAQTLSSIRNSCAETYENYKKKTSFEPILAENNGRKLPMTA